MITITSTTGVLTLTRGSESYSFKEAEAEYSYSKDGKRLYIKLYSKKTIKSFDIELRKLEINGDTPANSTECTTLLDAALEEAADLGGVGLGYLVKAEVTLTDAQIKALPTTPIELVAAPGAGKIIKIIDITAVQKIVSDGSYTNVNTGDYQTLINDNNVFGLSASPLEEGSGDWFSPGVTNYQGYYETTMENMPVILAVNNAGGGNFTGGNAANTLKINVYYVVVDL